jgi:hypothetical protein
MATHANYANDVNVDDNPNISDFIGRRFSDIVKAFEFQRHVGRPLASIHEIVEEVEQEGRKVVESCGRCELKEKDFRAHCADPIGFSRVLRRIGV